MAGQLHGSTSRTTMLYNCNICRCVGFKNPGALASHKSTSRACKLARACKEGNHEVGQPSSPVRRTADEYISMLSPVAYQVCPPSADSVEEILGTPISEFCKAKQPKDRFDSTLHLVAFMRQCRNTMGLSIKDTKKLLGLLFHPDFSVKNLCITTVNDLLHYEKQIASSQPSGWKQVVVRAKNDNVIDLVLHYQDPIQVLEYLFSNAKNKENFKLRPAPAGLNNRYSSPDTGDWWKQMQGVIEEKCPGGVIAGIILYSDQTSLSHNQRVSGYPLMISLANIDCVGRREEGGHALLAILPTYGASDKELTKSKHPTKLKLVLLHKCLEIILMPLKALSETGLLLEDPWGSLRWVFPLMYAYIGDHPETCKITCTFDTNRCNFPCSVCFCPKEQLSVITTRNEYRSERYMKTVHTDIVTTSTNIDDMSRRHSVHPVQCALWDFVGGDTLLGNPYRCVHPDKMHQFELGLFKTFIGILKDMAGEVPRVTFKQNALEILDQRMSWVGKKHRFPEFRLPSCNGKVGYFTSQATFQAFEHRSVLQVIIPLLLGIYQNPVVQVAISMWEWYSIAFRTREHTADTLDEMDRLMALMVRKLVTVLGKYQKSNFNIIKIHAMSHLSDSIRRSGIPCEYSTNLYEHLHILLMKVPYRASNKKDFAQQMTRHHQRLLAIRRKTASSSEIGHSVERETALDKAVNSGTNVLMGSKMRFQMDWLQQPPEDIPLSGKTFLLSQPEIRTNLKVAIETYCRENSLQNFQTLELRSGIAIPAGVGDRFGDWPMIARSTHKFHGDPYFSDVAIQMEGEGEEPLTSYGQLRLVFSSEVISDNGDRETRELVLVRWYDCKRRPERITACLVLQAVRVCMDVQSSRDHSSRRRRREAYTIIHISSILRVVQLIPHYGTDGEGEVLVNRFKF